MGADVNVQYRYETGPDGQLVVAGATVTVSEEKLLPAQLGGTGTPTQQRANSLPQDIVDIGNQNGAQEEIGLSASEREQLRRLQAADTAVRRHEGLHFRAAGGLGGTPNYQTVTGPDGKQYAVAGSVDVSGTRGADAEQAAREAQTLVLAATAPGDASAADISAARQFATQGNDNARAVRQEQNNSIAAPGIFVDLLT